MKNIFEQILDLIYLKKCYFCGKSKHSVKMCPDCYDKLMFCAFEANRIVDGVNVFCAGLYTKELQKMIRGLKYHKQRGLAYYQAKFMYEYWTNLKSVSDKDFVLVPVPLHPKREKRRKYNHMELVCIEFSKLTGMEYDFGIIKRVKNTKPQYKLSRKERLKNLSEAFVVEKLTDKPILLIDDICTTGSTFEEMIRELRKSGMKEITCFATATPV